MDLWIFSVRGITDYGLRYNTLVLSSYMLNVAILFNSFYTRALYRINTFIIVHITYFIPLPVLSSFTNKLQ